MKRDDVIRLAREAGMAYRERIGEFNTPLMDGVHCDELERFAALVAAAERERFAAECIDLVAMYGGPVDLEAAIRARGHT